MSGAPQYLIVGKIRRAHGLRGEVIVESHTDSPDRVFAPDKQLLVAATRGGPSAVPTNHLTIVSSRPQGDTLIVRFAELADRTAAERWRGRDLVLPADELTPLAPGEVYVHELEGMRVELGDGSSMGRVIGLIDLPQGLALEIEREGRPSVLLPYATSVVSVDRATRVIRIDPLPGLLD